MMPPPPASLPSSPSSTADVVRHPDIGAFAKAAARGPHTPPWDVPASSPPSLPLSAEGLPWAPVNTRACMPTTALSCLCPKHIPTLLTCSVATIPPGPPGRPPHACGMSLPIPASCTPSTSGHGGPGRPLVNTWMSGPPQGVRGHWSFAVIVEECQETEQRSEAACHQIKKNLLTGSGKYVRMVSLKSWN